MADACQVWFQILLCHISALYCEVQTESQDMLRFLITKSEHVEGFCLHIVGDVVGTCSVVASLAPLVAPGERFSSHIGHKFKGGYLIRYQQPSTEFVVLGMKFWLPCMEITETQRDRELPLFKGSSNFWD